MFEIQRYYDCRFRPLLRPLCSFSDKYKECCKQNLKSKRGKIGMQRGPNTLKMRLDRLNVVEI